MRNPSDKTIAFTFGSHPTKDPALRWQAVISFPPGATAETELPVVVNDVHGKPIKSGTFVFAGQKLKLKDGKASMTFADFIAGKHDTALWLHRKGKEPVPGGLTFA